MKNFFKVLAIITLVAVVGFSFIACGGDDDPPPPPPPPPPPQNSVSIAINKTGNETVDNVTALPTSGEVGDAITLNYTLANTKLNNRLEFSGTTATIAEVDSYGTGTRTYTIAQADVADGIVTINAVFTHSDKTIDHIAFADNSNVIKTYGDPSYTKAITNTGTGTGAITYTSSDETVATVDNSGVVTIHKVGQMLITATKAADDTYEHATAEYTLTVDPLQLGISTNPTVITTKQYDGNTNAAVTAIGNLTNTVVGDTVTVSASATYASANVGTSTITVAYTISGASAANYIKPVDYTVSGTITKANGADVNANPTSTATKATSVTLNTLTTTGGQTVEYARASTTTVPTSGWQDATLFSGLTPSTGYYFFARSKENANHNAGTAKTSALITTTALAPDQYWTGSYLGSGAWFNGAETMDNAKDYKTFIIDDFKDAFIHYNETGTNFEIVNDEYAKGYFLSLIGPTSGNPTPITLSGGGYLFIISSKEITDMAVSGLSMMAAFTKVNLVLDGKSYFLYHFTTPLLSESSYNLVITYKP